MSFYTSLSGLKGAQASLSVISNNVANVGSTGFKKSRAEFGDVISSSPLQTSTTAGQGTRLKAITQQFTQGGFQSTDRALDLAISGQGFFVTRDAVAGGQTTFTRNGGFGIDGDRYITDARGAYLQVLPVDGKGDTTASSLTAGRSLQVPLSSGDAKATSKIDLGVSLPSSADLPANRAVYTSTNPYSFNRLDPNSYNYASPLTVYDAAGNAQAATVYYTRTAAPAGTSTGSTWEARLFVGNQEASSNGSAATPAVPLTMQFDATGKMTTPSSAVAFGAVQPDGASAPIALTLDFGTDTKQSAQAFALNSAKQDGAASGQLDNVSVDAGGLITASYSNGTTQKLGKLMLANFSNPAGLRQLGDATWSVTGNSGEPIVGTPSEAGMGTIQSGALEQANVDITEELVALISAQRNFQANAKAIETANTLTQTIVQLN